MTAKEKSAKQIAQEARDRAMDEKLEREFKDPGKRAKRKRNVRVGWCATLIVLLLSSLINWGVVTGWGNVTIDRLKLVGNDGAEFSGLIYRPDNATDKTPAPAIIMFHGNAGNARNHESWAMEFARRGFVVVAPDQYGSGNSQGYFDGTPAGVLTPRSHLDEANMFYDYLEDLPFVDSNNILSSGHSMGCTAAERLGALHNAKGILLASPATGPEKDSELEQMWYNYTGNVAVMMGAVELRGANEEETIAAANKKPLHWLQRYPGFENETTIVPGKEYGSLDDGSGFVYEIEYNRIHEAAFVSTQTVGHLLQYGQQMIGDAVPNYIDGNDQIWPAKDYIGLLGIFAWAAFVFATALLLIEEVPAFASVRRPLARNVGMRGTALVVVSLVALLVPYLVIKTDAFGIVGGGNFANLRAAGFNLGFSNMGFGVIIGLTIVCTLGFIVFMLTERKKKAIGLTELGLTPYGYEGKKSRGERAKAIADMIGKSALVAAIAVAAGFAYTQLQSSVLGTDFYAWFFGIKDVPLSKIPNYLPYLGVFIAALIILSFDMNIIRRLPTTGNETKDLLIAMTVNTLLAITMVIIIVAVKWWLQTIGSPADTNWLWGMGLDTQRIWGMPVGMTVAAAGSTFIYKKTGNIWLCALLVGTVACLMGVLYGGTRFHYLTYFYA